MRFEHTVISFRWTRTSIIALIAACICANVNAQSQKLVDRAGNFSKSHVEGCKTISVQDVLDVLQLDWDIQAVAAPTDECDKFLETVQRKLRESFLQAGYPDAVVAASVDPADGYLRIQLTEGPQYKAGAIRVEGQVAADGEAIKKSLIAEPSNLQIYSVDTATETITFPTVPSMNSDWGATWTSGETISFTDQSVDQMRQDVMEELYRQGFGWAKVQVSFAPAPQPGIRDLVVRITEEGPKAKLSSIDVACLKINSTEGFLKYLGIKNGMPIDLNAVSQMREQLWDSGRFLRHDTALTFDTAHPGQANLKFDMMEHPRAPRLDLPLEKNSGQAAMVQLANDFNQDTLEKESAIFTLAGGTMSGKVVYEAGRGSLISAHFNPAGLTTRPSSEPAAIEQDWHLAMLDSGIGFISSRIPGIFKIDEKTVTSFFVMLYPNADDITHSFTFSLDAGVDSGGLARATILIAPVVALDKVTPKYVDPQALPPTAEISDTRIILTWADKKILTVERTNSGIRASLDSPDEHMAFELAPGAFEKEFAANQLNAPNTFDVNRPIASALDYLSDARLLPAGLPALQKLYNGQQILRIMGTKLFQPLDKFAQATWHGRALTPAISQGQPLTQELAMHVWGFILSSDLFEYGSWPWTIAHGAAAHMGHDLDDSILPELQRVISADDTGPIGCLAIAMALEAGNSNYSRAAAGVGLNRLSAGRAEHDLQLLLKGSGRGPEIISAALNRLGELSDEDTALLASALPPDFADAVAYTREVAKAHPNEPVADVLLKSTDKWWNDSLEKIVESRLKLLN